MTQLEIGTFVLGFDRAHDRLRAAITLPDTSPEDAFVPLFETLHWLVSLDGLADESGVTITADPDDLLGVRLARNRAGHQWANALALKDIPLPPPPTIVGGGRSPYQRHTVTIIRPASAWAWVWVEESALPSPDPSHAGRHYQAQKAAYENRLQGRPAHEVLDRLHAALAHLLAT